MLDRLTPQQKKMAAAIGIAGLLALVALMGRGKSAGAPAPDAGQLGATGQPAPVGSTFADNGEAAAGLGTSITEGLGAVAIALEGIRTQQGQLTDQITGSQQQLADQITGAVAAREGILTADATPPPEFVPSAAPAAIAATPSGRGLASGVKSRVRYTSKTGPVKRSSAKKDSKRAAAKTTRTRTREAAKPAPAPKPVGVVQPGRTVVGVGSGAVGRGKTYAGFVAPASTPSRPAAGRAPTSSPDKRRRRRR